MFLVTLIAARVRELATYGYIMHTHVVSAKKGTDWSGGQIAPKLYILNSQTQNTYTHHAH